MGTCEGRRPVLTALLVLQARVCADPQATRLIFLACNMSVNQSTAPFVSSRIALSTFFS